MGIGIGGFILCTGSLNEAFAMLDARRAETRKMVVEAHSKFLALEAQQIVDNRVLYPERDAIDRPLSWAENEMKRRQKSIRETGYRDPAVDFDFSVCLFPVEEKVVGTLYAEQESFQKWFFDLPEVDEYRYYDGSDSYLDRYTQEEWDERLRVWTLALNDFRDTPSEAGLTINLGVTMVLPSRIDVMPHIETKDVRANRYARLAVRNGRTKDVMEEDGQSNGTTRIIEALYEATDYMKTDAGLAEIETRKSDILARLPDITDELLLGFKPPV